MLLNNSNVSSNEQELFKQIWSLESPSKIRILIWKFAQNYVPTFQNLHYRRLSSVHCCPRCGHGYESSAHAVRDCLFAAQVWSKLDIQWPSSLVNFNEWLSWLLKNSAKNRKWLIAVSIWAIWFSRNKFVHERKVQSLEEIVTFIWSFGSEYRSSAESLKHPQPRSMVKWSPPPQGWFKVNVDAGVSIANNRVVTDFIIRNDEGFIMGSGFQRHNLVLSVVIAEAIAVLHGLQFALDMGFSRVILESDSRLVVNNIQKSSEDYSESRPFTWDVKNLARKFHCCRFQFVAREGNGAAHALVVEGMQAEGDSFWVEDAPLKVLEVADSDRRSGRPP
ncbi:hypothetical protein Gogos_021255 [Gossypium gossypioides]|uniref:RNase H type-1 domain-containing protein n=1 Tax=Gossypium gossypioides TaxID=34282 RepID=A0A7J9D462_GOSGO|nr:hypothetical protein [Gossypium gossypioides]